MDKKEAQGLVEIELENSKDKYNSIDCAVIETETIEKSWGWVFFYQSKEFIKSKDVLDMLAGNAPIIVNRNTKELVYTGTTNDIEHYIKEYENQIQSNT